MMLEQLEKYKQCKKRFWEEFEPLRNLSIESMNDWLSGEESNRPSIEVFIKILRHSTQHSTSSMDYDIEKH